MYEKFFKIFDFQSTLQLQLNMLLIIWDSQNVMAWNHITGPLCGESQGYWQIAGTVMRVVFLFVTLDKLLNNLVAGGMRCHNSHTKSL